jgi:hypothetical protein
LGLTKYFIKRKKSKDGFLDLLKVLLELGLDFLRLGNGNGRCLGLSFLNSFLGGLQLLLGSLYSLGLSFSKNCLGGPLLFPGVHVLIVRSGRDFLLFLFFLK